jgi:hypothetical protein
MSQTTITSPKGRLLYLNLNKKQHKDREDTTSPLGYSTRVEFDDTAENQEWKNTISKVNKAIVVEGDNNTFRIKAFSQFLPQVIDGKGNLLEELPNYYTGSKSTVQVTVTPYIGDRGAGKGSINFSGLTIHELEIPENASLGGAEGAKEAALAAMRAALNKK